jgi:hypothetical protein
MREERKFILIAQRVLSERALFIDRRKKRKSSIDSMTYIRLYETTKKSNKNILYTKVFTTCDNRIFKQVVLNILH